MSKKVYYSPAEFAVLASVKPATVRLWCRIERIKCIRISKRLIRIPHSEVREIGLI